MAEVQSETITRPESAARSAQAPAHHRPPARARHAADLSKAPAWAVAPVLHPAGEGRPLEAGLRGRAERSLRRDLGRVRLHDDASSRTATSGLDAVAATHGTDVFLGHGAPDPASPGGRTLLWHELTHVGEQAALGDRAGPLIQCQHRRATSSADVQEIRDAMDSATDDSTRAHAALDLLREYELTDAVEILVQLDAEQRVETIAGVLSFGDTDALTGAIFAVLYLSPNQRATQAWGVVAATILARMAEGDRMAVIEQVLRATGRAAEIPGLREGASALTESADNAPPDTVVDDDAAAAAVTPTLGGVTPGPWAPPGRQPIPFYLGNAAHIGIAAFYAAAHPGNAMFFNTSSVAAIIAAARRLGLTIGTGGLPTVGQLAMEPDIANLTLLHLFEIKPTRLQALGASEALLYAAAFTAAGLPLALGPTTEAGTRGVIPAPGGWYEFSSPQAGVITYQYRQPPRVRVRAPATSPSRSRAPSSSSNRTFMEQMAAITGLSGTALIVYLIISEGSRAFPPRNLIPVP
jgi:hypothetical protein